jgi:stage II sporulation protein M
MILTAWRHALKIFLLALPIGYLIGLMIITVFPVKPAALFHASTIGVRNVAVPLTEKAAASGVDPLLGLFVVNGFVAVVLAAFLFITPLFDPRFVESRRPIFRKMLYDDPTIRLLAALKGYRAIPDPRLRPLFATLCVAPMTGVIALGLLIGLLLAAVASFFDGKIILIIAYLLPHGLFEIPALVLAAAVPISAYLEVRSSLEQGKVKETFDRLKQLRGARQIRLAIGAGLGLLLVAALVEVHFTERIAAELLTLG